MFAVLICLALVAQAFSAPTPQVPREYLGTYESRPDLDQNVSEFFSVFQLPPQFSLTKPNVFYLYQEGEYYVTSIVFGPTTPPMTNRFKLGETQTTSFNGKNVEYVHTVETVNGAPVLKGTYRDTGSDLKFSFEATIGPNGFNATYTREGVTAKRFYDRIICPSVAGYYENVPEQQTPNFIEFASRVIPAPTGINWDSNTGVWLGRWGRDFVVKYIVTPSVTVKFPFRLNEKRSIELNGRNISYTYTLVEENFENYTITLKGEFTSETGTLYTTAVITPKGISVTYKAGEQTAARFYKRVLNPLVYGTYQNVPEASLNWAEFAAAAGKEDDNNANTQIQVYPRGQEASYRVQYASGKSYVFPFALNKTYEATTGPAQTPYTYTYNEKPSYSNDVYLVAKLESAGKAVRIELTFNATGLLAVYRAGPIVAHRYYRRVIPAIVLGTYESTPDTPEFAQFAQTIGSPELLQKTTVEITETPEHSYQQSINVEGAPAPAVFPFSLGQSYNVTLKGQNLTYGYMLLYLNNTPVLSTYWKGNGPTTFTVAAEFTPTGYTATYISRGRLATRTYTRVGAPVQPETYPTA